MILDIHTHNLSPNPQAIIDISSEVIKEEQFSVSETYSPDQRFSVGIHPWWLAEDISEDRIDRIEKAAGLPQVAIIGECGIDILKGGPLFRQMLVFKRMVRLSENVAKPLLIHDVKAHDIIVSLYKELKPSQPWIIHGFRSKPTVADMFLRLGMYLSFGSMFNPVTVHNAPTERILAETDDSGISIEEVIHNLSDTRGVDVTHIIAENSARLLSFL